MLDQILDSYFEEEFVTADGLDDAVIGVDQEAMRLIYSVKKIIEIFVEQGMTEDEAHEFFQFNTVRGGEYMGAQSPIWCNDLI